MSKLSKNKSYILYFVLSLVILWILAYMCFAFVMAELNPFKWEQSIRGGYVAAIVSILVVIFPISQIFRLEFKN
jgi:uncharacterized membrane protein YjfL (UPF0719 family)